MLKIRTYSIYPQGTEWLFYMEPTMKYNAESNWKENNYGKELWELLIMELIRGEHYYKRLEVKNP